MCLESIEICGGAYKVRRSVMVGRKLVGVVWMSKVGGGVDDGVSVRVDSGWVGRKSDRYE